MSTTRSRASDDEQYRQAQELLNQNKTSEARDLLTRMVSDNTKYPEVYCDLGVLAFQNNEPEAAKENLKKALELDPGFVLARRYLAFLYGHEANFDLAFATLSPLLRSPPIASEDTDLLKCLLESTTKLPPITWARLLTDLKTPSAEVKAMIDGHQALLEKLAHLEADKRKLQTKVNDKTIEYSEANIEPQEESLDVEKNFCILPWKHLNIKSDGTTQLCCQGPLLKDIQGNPLTVYERSLMEIWNSSNIRSVRSSMVSGIRVEECRSCWEVEDRGGSSRRMEMNNSVQNKRETIRLLKSKTKIDSFFCHKPPSDYQLDMGNTCNLKCRTCTSQFSSRIAADTVHQRWEKATFTHSTPMKNVNTDNQSRLNSKPPWYEDERFLFEEFLSRPEEISDLHIIGGEPLVLRQFTLIIQHLRSKGTPQSTNIAFTTNGTRFDPFLIEAISEFRSVSVSVSFDGLGDYFEYIRYPGKWNDFIENLDRYRGIPNIFLSAIPTFHIYNALNFSDLLRFCDDKNLWAIFNPLRYPSFLAPSVLPPKTRQVAIERLREYAETARMDNNRRLAEMLIGELKAAGNSFNHELFQKFTLFTNDLDASREKRFKDIYKEMIDLLAQDGIAWTDETLYALAADNEKL